MEFELKNAASIGDVKSKDNDNSLQYLNITVGVKGCPYNIVETKTVEYVFSNSITIKEAKDGVTPFAEKWVAENYPTV